MPVRDTIPIDINVSPHTPNMYYNALVKVVDQCAVKKTLLHPPKFEIKTVVQQ
jgi:putative redox protein